VVLLQSFDTGFFPIGFAVVSAEFKVAFDGLGGLRNLRLRSLKLRQS